jgi:alkylation response protein AidB-like acyl-CoA dehydrogenase
MQPALPHSDKKGSQSAGADIVERARKLAPLIESAAARIESERKIPGDIVDALREAQMFRLLVPRSCGGIEIDLPSFVEIIETISQADASTGWCLAQAGGPSQHSAYLSEATARKVFGDPMTIGANGPPGGPTRAVVVEGGYRVTGTWQFLSGSSHANWLMCRCHVYDSGGTVRLAPSGRPLERAMLFRKSEAQMTDVWQVIGLRGTASNTYRVEDLFVPADYTYDVGNPVELREGGPLYKFSTVWVHGYSFAAVALGIARATLASFIDLAHVKTPRHWAHTLRESSMIQYQVALAEIQIQSARAVLFQRLHEAWNTATEEGRPTYEQRLFLRLASTYAFHQAREVVEFAYRSAGATAIFNSNPFERRFRDINTVAQQVQAATSNMEVVGQVLLGMEPKFTGSF